MHNTGSRFYTLTQNRRQDNGEAVTFLNVTEAKCGLLCLQAASCVTFNYRAIDARCEVIDTSQVHAASYSLSTDSQWLFAVADN